MSKIKKILWAIDAKAQELNDGWWEPVVLTYLDRYFRKGRHHIRPGSVDGYALRAWMKAGLDEWEHVKDCFGIQEAIALGY